MWVLSKILLAVGRFVTSVIGKSYSESSTKKKKKVLFGKTKMKHACESLGGKYWPSDAIIDRFVYLSRI